MCHDFLLRVADLFPRDFKSETLCFAFCKPYNVLLEINCSKTRTKVMKTRINRGDKMIQEHLDDKTMEGINYPKVPC